MFSVECESNATKRDGHLRSANNTMTVTESCAEVSARIECESKLRIRRDYNAHRFIHSYRVDVNLLAGGGVDG